jgi:hypothetical protein
VREFHEYNLQNAVHHRRVLQHHVSNGDGEAFGLFFIPFVRAAVSNITEWATTRTVCKPCLRSFCLISLILGDAGIRTRIQSGLRGVVLAWLGGNFLYISHKHLVRLEAL